MYKLFFAVIALSCHLQLIFATSNFLTPKKSRHFFAKTLLETYVSETSQVQLFKDVSGFYVDADLADNWSDQTDSDFGPNTVKMTIGLYTSQTFLAAPNCLRFTSYNCTEYSCKSYPDTETAIYSPYFTATGYYANASVYLDYKEWNLESNASIADSCEANTILPYGRFRSGVIGMGIGSNSDKNFLVAKKFSVTLAQDLQSGHLGFGPDLSQVGSTLNVANFTADENWRIKAPDCEIHIANWSFTVNTSIIFDLNMNAIGLPWDIFNQTIEYLSGSIPMNCSSDTNQPICFYSGNINALPNISFIMKDQNLTISPAVYVQNISDPYVVSQTITLNLKALSPNLTDESYVTEMYRNYIILDAHVMRGYFIVFDGTTSVPTIGLYNGTSFKDDGFWIELLIGAIVFLSFVFCCCFCSFDKKENKKIHATEDDTMTMSEIVSTSQINRRDSYENNVNSPATAGFHSQESRLQTPLLVVNPESNNNESGFTANRISGPEANYGFSFHQVEE